jgi:hypothetical protein
MSGSLRNTRLLPPPAETILLYAADGLSKERGFLSRSGRPRTPERAVWVPLFRDLLQSSAGLESLERLAETGMRAWNVPDSMILCLNGAFRDITFRAFCLSALQRLAATANRKAMPLDPAQDLHESATQEHAPRPEAHALKATKPTSSPQRPRHPHPRGHSPSP